MVEDVWGARRHDAVRWATPPNTPAAYRAAKRFSGQRFPPARIRRPGAMHIHS